MARSRVVRLLRWLLVALLVVPLLVWLGIATSAKLTVLEDMPFTQVLGFVGYGLVSNVTCAVTGCEAELLEGMESSTFDADLLEATPVAFDVDERGRVIVAETGRMSRGAEDNRNHDYWLLDDLASRTVEDRRAYYRKWIEAGRIEDPEHFTRAYDRVVVLEDRDGDRVADTRRELAAWNDMASGLVAGVEAREGEIFVTAIPSLHRIVDRDGDAQPEAIDVLYTGFGVKTSLIGHDLHGLAWGPDGRLYFGVGDRGYHVRLPDGRVLEPTLGPGRGAIFRMNADGSGLEVFATGVRNPQELAFDDHGNLFTGDNNGDGGDAARVVYLVEGGETGWAMPYQTLDGDYVRGPWVAEKLWELQHPSQPAWVLPPVAHIANGPAGFVHYPGLGLPDRYRDHFFLCDYAYMPGRSGIWSFALEPAGAGFELVDRHAFAWSVLATDFDFGWDGRMFATVFDQIGQSQSIVEWRHPESRADPRVAELARTAAERMQDQGRDRLLELLAFPDQRLRLRAQYELARRREIDALVSLVRDAEGPLLSRLHALWGLGQIGVDGLRALAPRDFEWARSESAELRAQLARIAGEARADWLVPALVAGLESDAARVRFFSAQSLGQLGARQTVPALLAMLRANDDRDVFLRHAGVWALSRIGDLDAMVALRPDPARSLRMAALLVMRNARDPRIADWLHDEDPLIVVEAARAIYDGPIEPAMSALAALLGGLTPASQADTQTAQALHRRAIGANLRLRDERSARALAHYVEDERQLASLRQLALEVLGRFGEPPARDLTMGFYRPLPAAPAAILRSVFRDRGRALIASDLGARAMEIANEIGELPLESEELLELVRASARPPDERASALHALAARADEPEARGPARVALELGLADEAARVRIAARDLLLVLDPDAALAEWRATASGGATLAERQHAWRRLGDSGSEVARSAIAAAIDDWEGGEVELGEALEILEAARRSSDPALVARARRWLEPEPGAETAEALVAARRWALAGGDPAAGRQVFQTIGDCQRCHHAAAAGGGHGGGAGPPLEGVGNRGARYVLESLVAPAEQIAPGFGSVEIRRRDGSVVAGLLVDSDAASVGIDVGGSETVEIARAEIGSISDPVTGMPAMGLALEPDALRDVIAYVMTLGRD